MCDALYMEEVENRQQKFDTYMRDDFYNILKKESGCSETSMSSLLKNAFALRYYEKYPELKKFLTGD